jgi:acyl-CoA hydrolase
MLELPHTPGCLVCGPANPHGLHLSLHVDPETGIVRTIFTPLPQHIGFEGLVHGGVLATVVDEAMVWAATWAGKRFCVCGEMSIRFRAGAQVGQQVEVTAQVQSTRRGLIETICEIRTGDMLVATATGKYVPVSPQRNREVIATFVNESATEKAAAILRNT